MRHFGGGIGHIQSALHFQHDECLQDEECNDVFEGESMDTSDQTTHVGRDTATMLDEGGVSVAEDLNDSEGGDSEMETSSSASSGAEDNETELDTDDDGYDSL